MLLTSDALLIAGFPDKIPTGDPYAAFEGRLGGTLLVIDRETGETSAELPMEAPPVWDGLSTASGQVFVARTDGTLLCLEQE